MRALRRLAEVTVLTLGCAHGRRAALSPVGPGEGRLSRPALTLVIDRGVERLFETLVTRGRGGAHALRLRGDELSGWFSPEIVSRLERAGVGMGTHSRRWRAWTRWRGSVLVGWCARGVRVVEASGPEGFRVRTVTIERLLLVGRATERTWGVWIEGLMLTREGWRILPWVSLERAVETPRWGHTDVALWDCDLSRRWGDY